jgi:hypothetical protein
MRLQALVLGLLAACASARAEGQAVAPKAAPPALAPGPHNVVLNGVRFFSASEAPPRTRRPSCFCTGDQDKAASISRHLGDGF